MAARLCHATCIAEAAETAMKAPDIERRELGELAFGLPTDRIRRIKQLAEAPGADVIWITADALDNLLTWSRRWDAMHAG